MILEKVLSEAKQGSVRAQRQLFDLLSPRTKVLCCRYVKNERDAEEALQNGFYKLFKGLYSFTYSYDERFYSYAKTIMINECLSFLRANHTFYTVSDHFIPHTPIVADVFADEEPLLILDLIKELPVGYRTVLNMFALDDYSHAEIARALGISESTSRSQLARARLMLQTKLSLTEKKYKDERSK